MPGNDHHAWRILPLALLGVLLLCAGQARAHIADQYNSVHFHSGRPDFGMPPRRACLALRGEHDDRPTGPNADFGGGWESPRIGVELEDPEDGDAYENRVHRLNRALRAASADLQAGRWSQARRRYAGIGATYGWANLLRGGLRDRVTVLRQVEAMRAPLPARFAAALRRYLHGMARYDANDLAGAHADLQGVHADSASGFLRAHALYQLASIDWTIRQFPRAVSGYRQLLREFPRSPLREQALLMIARSTLLLNPPTMQEIQTGGAALRQLLRAFPQTRFRRAALGLRGRIWFLKGRYEQALPCYLAVDDLASVEIIRKALPSARQGPVRERLLAAYLRRLQRADSYAAYERAAFDVDRTRAALAPADAGRFTQRLLREPDLLAPYFYFRLYHCDNKPADFTHMARLADRVAMRHVEGALPPLVRVRLAEVYYQRRNYARALAWAERALRPRPFDRALFVRGAVWQRLRRYREAIADMRALLRDFPGSPLRRSAREELAILYESVGDLGSALDEYFTLGYQADIAFLLDASMTTPEIAAYLRRLPARTYTDVANGYWEGGERSIPHHYSARAVVTYALGVRLMRREQWREAARLLRSLPRTDYRAFSKGRAEGWADRPSPDPLTAVLELGRLQRLAATAKTDNARALALYRYATYYYTHGTLLLYDPALWHGNRAYGFDFWWNTRHATRQDNQAARAHMYEHEVYARTLRLCREIARRYPRSPVAPRALYRAACSAYYLAGFNGWWREEGERTKADILMAHLMKEITRRYPHHPLARPARKFAQVWAWAARSGE